MDKSFEYLCSLLRNGVYTVKITRRVEPRTIPQNSLMWMWYKCMEEHTGTPKDDFHDYYKQCGHPYVSTHPMFGPTFANLGALSNENAIIITDGDYMGRIFFKDLYQKLGLHICEYSFTEHDEIVAYSLSIPFVSTFVFAAVMKPQDAPGTTFKRHMAIAKGVLNEDETLLREILFNPNTSGQVGKIRDELKTLMDIIDHKDADALSHFIARIKANALR